MIDDGDMKYISTRDVNQVVSGAQAIVEGIAPDGGLYVPASFPSLSAEDWSRLRDMEYTERAAYVLSLYLDEFSYEELLGFAKEAYGRFYGDDPCPLSAAPMSDATPCYEPPAHPRLRRHHAHKDSHDRAGPQGSSDSTAHHGV